MRLSKLTLSPISVMLSYSSEVHSRWSSTNFNTNLTSERWRRDPLKSPHRVLLYRWFEILGKSLKIISVRLKRRTRVWFSQWCIYSATSGCWRARPYWISAASNASKPDKKYITKSYYPSKNAVTTVTK